MIIQSNAETPRPLTDNMMDKSMDNLLNPYKVDMTQAN